MHPALPLVDTLKGKQQDHIQRLAPQRKRGRNSHHDLQGQIGRKPQTRRGSNQNKPQRLGCVRVATRVARSQASGGALCVRNSFAPNVKLASIACQRTAAVAPRPQVLAGMPAADHQRPHPGSPRQQPHHRQQQEPARHQPLHKASQSRLDQSKLHQPVACPQDSMLGSQLQPLPRSSGRRLVRRLHLMVGGPGRRTAPKCGCEEALVSHKTLKMRHGLHHQMLSRPWT